MRLLLFILAVTLVPRYALSEKLDCDCTKKSSSQNIKKDSCEKVCEDEPRFPFITIPKKPVHSPFKIVLPGDFEDQIKEIRQRHESHMTHLESENLLLLRMKENNQIDEKSLEQILK